MNHLKIKTPKLLAKKGFSIPSSILGFALVSISSLALVSYMGNFQRVKQIYSQQVQEPYDHIALIEGMKNIILQSNMKVNNDGTFEFNEGAEGLCKIFENKDEIKTKITEEQVKFLQVKVTKEDIKSVEEEIFSDSRWQKFIGDEWELMTDDAQCSEGNGFVGDFTSSPLRKCFKLTNDDIYARLSIRYSQIDNTELDEIPVDIDKIKFEVKSMITRTILDSNNPEAEKWGISAQNSFVFATQVPRCSICDTYAFKGDKCTYVSLSGSSAGSLEQLVYHSPYVPQNICDPGVFSVSHVAQNVIQSGQSVPGEESVLETVVETNIALSCTSNIFKCKPPASPSNPSPNIQFNNKDFDPFFRLNFGFNLETQGSANLEEISIQFNNLGDTISPANTLLTGFSVNRNLQSQESSSGGAITETMPLKDGGNNFTYSIGSDVCEEICGAPDQYVPTITAKLKECSSDSVFTLDGRNGSPSVKVACTVCHMKNCHQYGLGTFGPLKDVRGLEGLPEEPDDGNIPECAMNKKIGVESSHGIEIADFNLRPGDKLALEGGRLVKDLENNSKAGCFAYGDYYVVNSSNSFVREDTCFEVSKQSFKAGTPQTIDGETVYTSGLLANLSIAYQGSSASNNQVRNIAGENTPDFLDETTPTPENIKRFLIEVVGLNFTPNGDFYGTQLVDDGVFGMYNLAAQGLFHTPLDKLSRFDSSNGKVSVNFQMDYANMVHGGWPLITSRVEGIDRRLAFFYREPFSKVSFDNYEREPSDSHSEALDRRNDRPARPMFLKIPGDFNFGQDEEADEDSTSNSRLLLAHHIRYKGLIQVNRSSEGRPYLCKKTRLSSDGSRVKDIFKLAPAGGNFDAGYAKCRTLGDYHFNPPTNHKEWLAALHAVAPNHPRYPFPEVFSFADGVPFLVNDGSGVNNDLIDYRIGGSFTYDTDRFSGALLDQKMLIDTDDKDAQGRRALASVKSAWVALVPNIGDSPPSVKKAADWRQDLLKIGYAPNSIYTYIDGDPDGDDDSSPRKVFEKVNDVTTSPPNNPNLNLIGILDGVGVPMERSAFHLPKTDWIRFHVSWNSNREVTNPNRFYDRFRNPCRYNNQVENPLQYNRPHFRKGAKENWECDSSSNQDKMNGDDFQEISRGLYTTGEFFQKPEIQKDFLVINEEKFCDSYELERKRRQAARHIVTEYNKSYVQDQIRQCREDYVDGLKNNTDNNNKTYCDRIVDAKWTSYLTAAKNTCTDSCRAKYCNDERSALSTQCTGLCTIINPLPACKLSKPSEPAVEPEPCATDDDGNKVVASCEDKPGKAFVPAEYKDCVDRDAAEADNTDCRDRRNDCNSTGAESDGKWQAVQDCEPEETKDENYCSNAKTSCQGAADNWNYFNKGNSVRNCKNALESNFKPEWKTTIILNRSFTYDGVNNFSFDHGDNEAFGGNKYTRDKTFDDTTSNISINFNDANPSNPSNPANYKQCWSFDKIDPWVEVDDSRITDGDTKVGLKGPSSISNIAMKDPPCLTNPNHPNINVNHVGSNFCDNWIHEIPALETTAMCRNRIEVNFAPPQINSRFDNNNRWPY